METLRFAIKARDFRAAGAASRALKQHLKRIGAESDAVRRAMIAAYEAEMNVVIHADGGVLEATVAEDQLDVEVRDGGPGIADVPAAMREGFSTASAEARALGFGAGMGLPNIERNSDRMRVTSTVGEGTTVSFTVRLRPERMAGGGRLTSLAVHPELCRDCRRCVTACPTGALRVRDAQPLVLGHLCVDCTDCIAACAPGALALRHADTAPTGGDQVTLVVPPSVLVDYDPFGDAHQVLAALRQLAYGDVVVMHGYEQALRAAVLEQAARRTHGAAAPVISPVCPAVVSLMELRFPALLPSLAPLASPLEAAQLDLDGREAVFVASCPSQRTVLLTQRPTAQRQVIGPADLRDVLLPRLVARTGGEQRRAEAVPPSAGAARQAPGHPTADAASAGDVPAPRETDDHGVLVVTGAAHVVEVLDAIENGLLSGAAVVEPYLCDGGCLGSPLLAGDPYVATWRWKRVQLPGVGLAHERLEPFRPRPGIRLSDDMATAISMLAELERTTGSLPGKDCGACGAATCSAFAEDIVMGRAVLELCPYVSPPQGDHTPPDEGSTS